MAPNASTDSLSSVSSLHSDSGLENLLDADQTSDEIANFYQKMTISTTRRLPAKNVPQGSAPYVFETVEKTTKTLISHSLTPPDEMLRKSKLGRASKGTPRATRYDEADSASDAPPPQTEPAEHVFMSAPSPAVPAHVYRPRVRVFADEMLDWPTYPSDPSIISNGDAATLPSILPVNRTSRHEQATPTISAAASVLESQAVPPAHPRGSSVVVTGNQPPSSVSAAPDSQLAQTGTVAGPSNSTANADTAAFPPIAFDTAVANQPPPGMPSASQGAQSAGSQLAATLRPSARGSKLRFSQIQAALDED